MEHVPEKGNLLVRKESTVQIIITVDTDSFRSQEYEHNRSIIKYGCSMSNFLQKERTAFKRKAIPSAWWLSNTFALQPSKEQVLLSKRGSEGTGENP